MCAPLTAVRPTGHRLNARPCKDEGRDQRWARHLLGSPGSDLQLLVVSNSPVFIEGRKSVVYKPNEGSSFFPLSPGVG